MVGLTHGQIDIRDANAVAAAIIAHAPSSIVNAAAYTAVDKAESEPNAAFAVNRNGAAVVAQAAASANIPLVHLSTDYVFDGVNRVPYREDDPVHPQGAYARSKEEDERAVRAAHRRHLILRTAGVHRPFGTNFVKTMLRIGAERDELRVVDDQTGSPTSTHDLAEAILTMIDMAKSQHFTGWGTYHYAGADAVTWYEFAVMIFAEASGARHRGSDPSPTPSFPAQRSAPPIRCSTRRSFNAHSASGLGRCATAWARLSSRCLEQEAPRERHHPRRRIGLAALSHHQQLMAVYNKPLIYYPLSLMLAGIREVLIISTPEDQDRFVRLLGDGSRIGMSFSYAAQPRPEGLAQVFVIGSEFVGTGGCALVLGDNIFYGTGLTPMLLRATARLSGCTVFACLVNDPERYGVVEFDEAGNPIGIVEKPKEPKSHWAVTGLYFYDNRVLDIAAGLKPSARGELEITDVNLAYLGFGELNCERMGRGFAWLDTGTPDDAEFVRTIEQRQGWMIACIEEIAYRSGFIDAEQLLKIAASLKSTYYGRYLETVAHEARHQY